MFFFPIRADLPLRLVPFVTTFILLVCLAVFAGQLRSEERVQAARISACNQPISPGVRISLQRWVNSDSVAPACREFLHRLTDPRGPRTNVADLSVEIAGRRGVAQGIRPQIEDELRRLARTFRSQGGEASLTERLVYVPSTWNPVTMITAAFAHGGTFHLLGNLFFFWVFAAALEGLLGWWRFSLLILAICLGTHAVYSLAVEAVGGLPTLGLSGVVYGVMALFAWLAPDVRIRVIVWFLLWLRTFVVPAWYIALLYVGTDAWELWTEGMTRGVNLVAHVSGALIAVGIGALFFRRQRLARLRADESTG